jgi:hypothetical protein
MKIRFCFCGHVSIEKPAIDLIKVWFVLRKGGEVQIFLILSLLDFWCLLFQNRAVCALFETLTGD